MEFTKENFAYMQTTLENIRELCGVLIKKQNVNANGDAIREIGEWIAEMDDPQVFGPEIAKMRDAWIMLDLLQEFEKEFTQYAYQYGTSKCELYQKIEAFLENHRS